MTSEHTMTGDNAPACLPSDMDASSPARLPQRDLETIIASALHVAAIQYRQDAQNADVPEGMREQFRSQAEDAETIANRLGAGDVVVRVAGEATAYESVYEYFVRAFGGPAGLVEDASDCPIDSACGAECRKAIDSANEFLQHVRAYTGGRDVDLVREMAARACNVYWRG